MYYRHVQPSYDIVRNEIERGIIELQHRIRNRRNFEIDIVRQEELLLRDREHYFELRSNPYWREGYLPNAGLLNSSLDRQKFNSDEYFRIMQAQALNNEYLNQLKREKQLLQKDQLDQKQLKNKKQFEAYKTISPSQFQIINKEQGLRQKQNTFKNKKKFQKQSSQSKEDKYSNKFGNAYHQGDQAQNEEGLKLNHQNDNYNQKSILKSNLSTANKNSHKKADVTFKNELINKTIDSRTQQNPYNQSGRRDFEKQSKLHAKSLVNSFKKDKKRMKASRRDGSMSKGSNESSRKNQSHSQKKYSSKRDEDSNCCEHNFSLMQTQEKNAMKKIQNRLKLSSVVYKDSKLRNIKHQTDHLLNTHQKQIKARKDVKQKINNHPVILKKHAMVPNS